MRPPLFYVLHPMCSFVGADDSVRSNTAQRCHSEPVLTLAWESVSRARRRGILASLCEGGVKAEGFDGGRDNDTPPVKKTSTHRSECLLRV